MRRFAVFFYVLILGVPLSAQSLEGVRICIDPGHGGYESDDRFIAATGFWESESNLDKALQLKEILEEFGATVILTRYGNDGEIDDLSLSERVAVANENDVDYFNSIHSNGFNGTSNSTLMLYRGYDDDPWFDEAKVMGEIMAVEIFNAHRTTHWSNRGDWSFRPEWGTQGYGVLRGTLMPATISEGSHHDYIPESWRLLNSDYRRHEAWAIARSFLQYFNAGAFPFAEITGIVRDLEKNVSYYFIPGTNDARQPVNGFTVTLQPDGRIYQGDSKNNGFYLFDRLQPGNYTLIFEAEGYLTDSVKVTVQANKTAFADIYLDPKAAGIPNNISVMWNGPGSVKISVLPTKRTSGYRALISRDGETFTDSVYSTLPEIEIPDLEKDSLYFFKIRSVNEYGATPANRQLLAAIPSDSLPDILVVNGFDRSTNTRGDYIRMVAGPLSMNGKPFSSALNDAVITGQIDLKKFSTVFWILGDESSFDTTLTISEQNQLKSFLDQGGNLFISGSEIGYDLAANGGIPDNFFYRHYLKARYLEDSPNGLAGTYYMARPISYGLFEGIGEFSFDNGTQGTIDVDYPDVIEAASGGIDILTYVTGESGIKAAGAAYEGLFPEGSVPGRLVHLAIPFETIYPVEIRSMIMERVLQFFAGQFGSLAVQSEARTAIRSFVLKQNYPNPFNPITTIEYQLPESGPTSLIVYDAIGRKVRTLVNGPNLPGRYQISFDGSGLASGVYFYVLRAGDHVMKRKMMLLK